MFMIVMDHTNSSTSISIGNHTNITLLKLKEIIIKLSVNQHFEPYLRTTGTVPAGDLVKVLELLKDSGIKNVDLFCDIEEKVLMVPLDLSRKEIASCLGPVQVQNNKSDGK